jgi:TatD DNase family protein
MGRIAEISIPRPISAIRFVDSHAHLDMEEFDVDREDVIRRAFDSGIDRILCPIDISSGRSLDIGLALAEKYPAISAAAGLHPHQAKSLSAEQSTALRKLAEAGTIRAIGEIGLDFHYHFSTPEEQRRAFRDQLALARESALPVIVHSRQAGREVIDAVRDEGVRRGVMHCFTEDWDIAKAMLDTGFLISFSGIVTFPKAQDLRDVARKVPLDRILVETDSPYLAPVPHRGKRNEPAHVVETAKILAGLKDLPLDAFTDAVRLNFLSLFAIPK